MTDEAPVVPQATPEVVAHISTAVDLTPEQIASVISAWNAVRDGDPLGTIRRDENGTVAVRVNLDGMHLWRVTAADGGQWSDQNPTLSWPQIYP